MSESQIRAFVFTDIVGSTSLKMVMGGQDSEERNDRFAREILRPHRELLESQLARFDGRLISSQGDGHFLEFRSPVRAVKWAIDVQTRHEDQPIETPGSGRLGVKIGIHVGPAAEDPSTPGNFIGTSVDHAARLVELGTADKILVSEVVATMIRDDHTSEVILHDHGLCHLAGIGDRPVFEILYGNQRPGPLGAPAALPPAAGEGDTEQGNRTGMDAAESPAGLSRRKLLAGVFCLAAAFLAFLFWRSVTASRRRVIDSAAHRADARHFLLTLPGMSGGWWFDEIPWYSPEIRQLLLDRITVKEYVSLRELSTQSDVDAFYRRLAELCEISLRESRDDKINRRYELLRDAKPFDDVMDTTSEKSRWRLVEQQMGANELTRAVSLHLRGLLHWKMNVQDAEELLQKARRDYTGRDPELKALCIADTAAILQQLRRWRDATREYESARGSIPLAQRSPYLNLYTMAMESETRVFDDSKARREIPELLNKAARQRFVPPLDENHPLYVLLRSREALYNLEIWQLKTAERKGGEACQMIDRSGADPQSAHLYYRSRQFLALARYFQGKFGEGEAAGADSDFRELLQFIKGLVESDQIAEKEKPQWRRFRPNLLGRLADIQLFGEGDAAAAAQTLEDAASEARWFEGTPKAAYLARIRYKRAIALSLAGQHQEARGAQAEADRIAQQVESPGRIALFRRYREVCAALVAEPTGPETTDRLTEKQTAALLEIADQAAQNSEQHGTSMLSRDDRQLQLFLCEILLASDAKQPGRLSLQQKTMIDRLKTAMAQPLQKDGQDYLKRVADAAASLVE